MGSEEKACAGGCGKKHNTLWGAKSNVTKKKLLKEATVQVLGDGKQRVGRGKERCRRSQNGKNKKSRNKKLGGRKESDRQCKGNSTQGLTNKPYGALSNSLGKKNQNSGSFGGKKYILRMTDWGGKHSAKKREVKG